MTENNRNTPNINQIITQNQDQDQIKNKKNIKMKKVLINPIKKNKKLMNIMNFLMIYN
jgi:hypothetical protein